MRSFMGILTGFATLPAMLGLMALFGWLLTKIDRNDFAIGAALAIGVFVVGFLMAVKVAG